MAGGMVRCGMVLVVGVCWLLLGVRVGVWRVCVGMLGLMFGCFLILACWREHSGGSLGWGRGLMCWLIVMVCLVVIVVVWVWVWVWVWVVCWGWWGSGWVMSGLLVAGWC